MPLMIGALTSLWLDKVLLAIKKMCSPDWLVALEQDSIGLLHICPVKVCGACSSGEEGKRASLLGGGECYRARAKTLPTPATATVGIEVTDSSSTHSSSLLVRPGEGNRS